MSTTKIITKIGITKDKISSRGGIALFLRYIKGIGLYQVTSKVLYTTSVVFGFKGLQLNDFLKQIFAFFIDGNEMTMSGFDHRKSDERYACLLGYDTEKLASQHQMKRFFSKLPIVTNSFFNRILHELFVWRLHISQPRVIILGTNKIRDIMAKVHITTVQIDCIDKNKQQGSYLIALCTSVNQQFPLFYLFFTIYYLLHNMCDSRGLLSVI